MKSGADELRAGTWVQAGAGQREEAGGCVVAQKPTTARGRATPGRAPLAPAGTGFSSGRCEGIKRHEQRDIQAELPSENTTAGCRAPMKKLPWECRQGGWGG